MIKNGTEWVCESITPTKISRPTVMQKPTISSNLSNIQEMIPLFWDDGSMKSSDVNGGGTYEESYQRTCVVDAVGICRGQRRKQSC